MFIEGDVLIGVGNGGKVVVMVGGIFNVSVVIFYYVSGVDLLSDFVKVSIKVQVLELD